MSNQKSADKEEKKSSGQAKQGKQAKEKEPAAKKAQKKGGEVSQVPKDYVPRLKAQYNSQIIPVLMQKFQYKNKLEVPRLEKITMNVGIGEATQNPKLIELITQELMLITGQRPVITKAKKSISNFKLRKGMPIGCMVTLRGNRMFEFFDRLITIAIPRIRDFRGLSDRSFDGRGNYTLGVREQIIFTEIDYDKVEKIRGMDITIVTTARKDEEAYELLKEFGVPFRKK